MKILVCLNCGSTRLKRKTYAMGIIPGSSYVCKDCGFECPVMLEVSREEENENESEEGEGQ